MSRIIGYVLALVGLVGVGAYIIPQIREAIPFPEQVSNTILIVGSLIVVAVGVFLIMKSGVRGGGKQKSREVPIFRGKDVIGYRRT